MTRPWSPIRKHSVLPSVRFPPGLRRAPRDRREGARSASSVACATTRDEFARLHVATKVELLEDCLRGTRDVAADWVAAACRAKGISLERARRGRRVDRRARRSRSGTSASSIRTLREIHQHGAPVLRDKRLRDLAARRRRRSRHAVRLVRRARSTAASPPRRGFSPASSRSEVGDHQASFYKKTRSGGPRVAHPRRGQRRVDSADGHPLQDVRRRERRSPQDEPRQRVPRPVLRARVPAAHRARDTSRSSTAAREVGSYLCYHPSIGDVHITGSDKTHDLIVWGPPGAEREDRKRRNDPLLKKPITSELGNVSPVLVVPGSVHRRRALEHGRERWPAWSPTTRRSTATRRRCSSCPRAGRCATPSSRRSPTCSPRVPPRKAYYPGAAQRYEALTTGHADVRKIGSAGEHALPWTLVLGLDAAEREREELLHGAVLLDPQRGLDREHGSGRVPPGRRPLRERPRLGHVERDALRAPEGRGVAERQGRDRRRAPRSPVRNRRGQRVARARLRARHRRRGAGIRARRSRTCRAASVGCTTP